MGSSVDQPTEEQLADILSFIDGTASFSFAGKGITTHPQFTDDDDAQRLHKAVLILEGRGKVARHYVAESGSVTWKPT